MNNTQKVDIDWENLGFAYYQTKYRYVANFQNGAWNAGGLTTDANVVLSEGAGVLHYCQTCFEGLKAYRTIDNHVVVFRPDLNAARLIDSANRLEIPPVPTEQFLSAIEQVVRANQEYVPPYGTGASLYLRPLLFATGAVLGVSPATAYQFRVFGSPVGPYFKKTGNQAVKLKICDLDRAAPRGTGHIKAGLNYAMSIQAITTAHQEGFAENLYLDSQTRTKIEETGGANCFFVDKNGAVITPKSETILPSITRRSLMYIAQNILGLSVQEREITLNELPHFVECGLCGTAAVISPVQSVNDHGKEIVFAQSQTGLGPVSQKLYDTLTGMQYGRIKAPDGWIKVIC